LALFGRFFCKKSAKILQLIFKFMSWQLILTILTGGAVGALLSDILEENKLHLPKIQNGDLYLGSIGGLIVGAFAGYAIDGNFVTAMTAGFMGKAVIQGLVLKSGGILVKKAGAAGENTAAGAESIENIIRRVATSQLVDPELALTVAKCESQLNPLAVGKNTNGSLDRGLFQINSRWHPEVTELQAFNPEFATKFFCDAWKNGNLDWWNASRACWGK
jgi:hypothetical protein